MAEGDDTAAVQSIINQLKHDDCQVRTKATGRLTTVAAALGPERTRNELLPFLQGKRILLPPLPGAENSLRSPDFFGVSRLFG